MGCSSCSSISDGGTPGCQSNGSCKTGSCNKRNTFDWLSDMEAAEKSTFDVVEVRFKNGRKDFFRNKEKLDLTTGDAVVVNVPNGHHIGHVSLQGELVRLQMRKKGVENNQEIRDLYRIASPKDIEKFRSVKAKENSTLHRTREIIQEYQLGMKLTDIEFQADNTKATFYYSADDRVDFRELIKTLASEFKIRIEMRQISLRQEASRLGGIGSCGRELCCSTWLSDFATVATQAARYQNLSLNPTKLSGQCGRLKCCLNYELDTYMEALEDIPKISEPLLIESGKVTLQKTDIFRKIMWFSLDGENTWHPLNISRVKEIQKLNKEGKKPATLLDDELEEKPVMAALNSDLVAMDRKFNRNKNRKRKGKKPGGNPSNKQQAAGNQKPNSDQKASHQHKAGNPQKKSKGGQQKQGPPRNKRKKTT